VWAILILPPPGIRGVSDHFKQGENDTIRCMKEFLILDVI